jgi:hypothetical protein
MHAISNEDAQLRRYLFIVQEGNWRKLWIIDKGGNIGVKVSIEKSFVLIFSKVDMRLKVGKQFSILTLLHTW